MGSTTTRRRVLVGMGGAALVGGAWAWNHLRPMPLRRDVSGAPTRDLRVPDDGRAPQLVVASGDADPTVLTEKALAALGSLGRFVRAGETVLVKPNIGWVRTPLHAANTNPAVVAAVVKAAYAAGAKRVVVADGSCDDSEKSYERSGIARAASDAGAEVVLPRVDRFQSVALRGRRIDSWLVFDPVLGADRVINVPVLKHHALSTITSALKNWFGILGGDRHQLHGNLSAAIADANRFLRPTLTVIDASRVLLRNGPKGGNLEDTSVKSTVIAGVDPVAADARACEVLGVDAEEVSHLVMAANEGLGTLDWRRLRTKDA